MKMGSSNTNIRLLPLLAVLSGLLAVSVAQSPYEFHLTMQYHWCVARSNSDNLGPWHAPAHLWNCNTNEDQIFRFVPEPKPDFGRVVGRLKVGYRAGMPQLCLDVEGGVLADGRPVRLWECNGTNAQRWLLKINSHVSYQYTHEGLQSTTQYFTQLFPSADPSLCLRIPDSANYGTRMELSSIIAHDRNRWGLRPRIVPWEVYPHVVPKFANLTQGIAQGINVTHSILWSPSPTNPPPDLPSVFLYSTLDPSKCIARNSDPNTKTAWSALIHMWGCNIWAEDQNIRFLPTPFPRNGRIFGMLQLGRHDAHAQCLDVPGGWFDVGQIVRLWECNGSEAQLFSLDRTAVGLEWRFKVSPIARPDLCVAAGGYTPPASIPNGASLVLERCDAFADQAVPAPGSRAHWSMSVQGGGGSSQLQAVPLMSKFSWATQPLNETHSLSWHLMCTSDSSPCPNPISPPPPVVIDWGGGSRGGGGLKKRSVGGCGAHVCDEL